MQIEKISVTGLFGIFDHVIPLNTEEGITIIHAPNGFGKTAILRLIYDLFGQQNDALQKIPFQELRVDCSNGVSFGVTQDISLKDVSDHEVSLKVPQVTTIPFNLNQLSRSKSSIDVYLIESQRLLNAVNDKRKKISSISPKITDYSRDLAKHIRAVLSEYGAVSQSLDRTFPARAFSPSNITHATHEELWSRIDQLEEERSHLISVGLLKEDTTFELPPLSQTIDESMSNEARRILSIYVKDTEEKLRVFYKIKKRLELLRRIINKKFSCSHKEILFDQSKGFVFKKNMGTINPLWGELKPTDLSSGEQHELVLLYALLFKVKPGSLVMIDEPELSLHVGWQVEFLKDLQEIIKLTNIQILIATHSPDIIQDRWDLTVELKGPKG
jgi:ABC-type dipeptide/oligopeptide/nickel transport system ATPase component